MILIAISYFKRKLDGEFKEDRMVSPVKLNEMSTTLLTIRS